MRLPDFYGGHYVRDEFADGKLHIRKVIGVRFFLGRIPLRQSLFIEQFQKNVGDLRVELCTTIFTEFFVNNFRWKRITVDSTGVHSIVAICNSHNAGMDGDLCSGQSVRIAFSVITLMVTSCDFCRMRDQGYVLQDLGTDNGVFFIRLYSSSVSCAGLFRNGSGIPILPIS